MAAVWCKKLKELVNKNAPCEWQRRQARDTAAPERQRGARVRPRKRS